MTITPVTVAGFPRLPVPFNNITPFTYRDGLTYLEVLERLRAHLVTVIDEVNAGFEGQGGEYIEQLNDLAEAVNAALNAQADQVNDAVAQWLDVTIENNDEITRELIDRTNTKTFEAVKHLVESLHNTISTRAYSGTGQVKLESAIAESISSGVKFGREWLPREYLDDQPTPENGEGVTPVFPIFTNSPVSDAYVNYDQELSRNVATVVGTGGSNNLFLAAENTIPATGGTRYTFSALYLSTLDSNYLFRFGMRWYFSDGSYTVEWLERANPTESYSPYITTTTAPQGATYSRPVLSTFSGATTGHVKATDFSLKESEPGVRAVSVDENLTIDGNLAGFWNTRIGGLGTITREGVTFHVSPRPAHGEVPTNNIYVHGQDGNDGNDGLSPSHPLQTLNGVYRHVLRRLTPEQAKGARWVVHCRGIIAPPPQLKELPDFPMGLEFDGGPLVGGDTVPEGGIPQTRIVKGHGGSSLIMGLWFEPGIDKVIVKRLQFDGFAIGFNGYGVIMKGGGYIEIEDCIAVGCDCGFAVIDGVEAYIRRCLARDCTSGFRGHYMSSFTWTDCEARDNTGNGFSASRGAVGHLDFSHASGNVNGLMVNMQARCAVVGGTYINNRDYGVRAEGNTEWSNHKDYPVDYGVNTPNANGIAPFAHFGGAKEVIIAQRSTQAVRSHQDQEVTTETGFTDKKTVRVVSTNGILENHFMGPTKKMVVRVLGSFQASTFDRDIIVRLATFDGQNINDTAIASMPADTVDRLFELTTEFTPKGGNQVKLYRKMERSGLPVALATRSLTFPNELDISPRIVLDHIDASTSTKIRAVEIWVEG